jgi:hypothetical protein
MRKESIVSQVTHTVSKHKHRAALQQDTSTRLKAPGTHKKALSEKQNSDRQYAQPKNPDSPRNNHPTNAA